MSIERQPRAIKQDRALLVDDEANFAVSSSALPA
jgi:hypothetical protein